MSKDEDGYNKASDNYRYGKVKELVDTTVSSILVMQSGNSFRNQCTGEALTDPKWTLFLSTNGKFGDMHKAEVHVFSDAVLCVGPGNNEHSTRNRENICRCVVASRVDFGEPRGPAIQSLTFN